ncbi:hypothetical protein BS50DRAFT_575362 [Corynespora cassiicola Philippines]|uniref:Uncharacterized protein n=1 Tax=Corynespora cassiicola Philippines TaxID=1448308 RepID=A0A2T2NIZ2_CORCC|nr:hypothetical protein BS50DRAFT_575362 [Corynespora cassiicola Philippines]
MDDVDMAGATSAKSPRRPRAGQAVVDAKRAARAERKQTSAVRKTEKNATKAARKKSGILHRKVLKERKAFQQLFQADEGKALDTLLDGLGGFGLTNPSAPQKTANKKPDAPASQPLQETSLASNSLHGPDKSNEVVNDPGHVESAKSAKSARKERALNKKQEAIKKAAERRGMTVEELQMQKKERRVEKQERKLQRQQKSAEGQGISLENYNKAQQDSKRKKRQKRQNAKNTRVQQAEADKPHSNGASLPNMGIVDFGAPMEL